jgi:hypothetical protein
MITKLPESSGNVIGFVIKGKLVDEDYKQGLIPPVEDVIKTNPKFRILLQMQDFTGWTAHGAWDDFVNWPKFMSCERMAIVVDDGWHEFMSWLLKVAAKIVHSEIKFFPTAKIADAWAWLRTP